MNRMKGVPLDAISKGRSFDKVLKEYMRIWRDAKESVDSPGKSEDEIFADTMKVVAYRIYLLGVEDGMKRDTAS